MLSPIAVFRYGSRSGAICPSLGIPEKAPAPLQAITHDPGQQSHIWGYAASPVLDCHLCFVNFGPGERSFLLALDKRNRKTVWQCEIPRYGVGMKRSELEGKDQAGELI